MPLSLFSSRRTKGGLDGVRAVSHYMYVPCVASCEVSLHIRSFDVRCEKGLFSFENIFSNSIFVLIFDNYMLSLRLFTLTILF